MNKKTEEVEEISTDVLENAIDEMLEVNEFDELEESGEFNIINCDDDFDKLLQKEAKEFMQKKASSINLNESEKKEDEKSFDEIAKEIYDRNLKEPKFYLLEYDPILKDNILLIGFAKNMSTYKIRINVQSGEITIGKYFDYSMANKSFIKIADVVQLLTATNCQHLLKKVMEAVEDVKNRINEHE